MSQIKDISLAKSGHDKINWVKSYMPVLNKINEEFTRTKPFAGKKISMSIHLEAKTAYLAITLAAGGAEVYVTGCNPLSTQDDVAAALVDLGFEVNAWRGVTDEEYESHLKKTLSLCPDVMIDDGGDLTQLLHGECREYGKNLIGAFHHPVEVYMDMETLTTLDERNYIAGLAELLKHGFIHDMSILDYVEEHRDAILNREQKVLEELFQKNCAVKNYVVSMDEQEKGLRQILNYGHTMGHAVEVLSGFDLIHGECVSIGIVFAAELARMKGLCTAVWADRQRCILEKVGLPVDFPASLDADELIRLMKMDKKVRQGKTLFVLPAEPGKVSFGVEASEEEIRETLRKICG